MSTYAVQIVYRGYLDDPRVHPARLELVVLAARDRDDAVVAATELARRRELEDLVELPQGEPDADDSSYVITVGEQVVWRGRARLEDWERFEQVSASFKKKYGGRFRSLTPTDAAKRNLLGDKRRARLTCT